jgi:hypothetical protein
LNARSLGQFHQDLLQCVHSHARAWRSTLVVSYLLPPRDSNVVKLDLGATLQEQSNHALAVVVRGKVQRTPLGPAQCVDVCTLSPARTLRSHASVMRSNRWSENGATKCTRAEIKQVCYERQVALLSGVVQGRLAIHRIHRHKKNGLLVSRSSHQHIYGLLPRV